MFPELKRSLVRLIVLFSIIILIYYLWNHSWNDSQQKQKQREMYKNKYGIEMTNDTLLDVRDKIKAQLDNPQPNMNYSGIYSYDNLFYYTVTGIVDDPLSRGQFDVRNVIMIDSFKYKNYNVIVYIRK